MNIPYSYIIAVPAASVTVNKALMLALAEQIKQAVGGRKIVVVPVTKNNEGNIWETAELILASLFDQFTEAIFTKDIHPVLTDSGSKDEQNRRILNSVLNMPVQGEVLVLVLDPSFAEGIGRVLLWDFLDNRRINPHLDQVFNPGEAAIIDCKLKSRNTLHPEGYERWVARVYAGQA